MLQEEGLRIVKEKMRGSSILRKLSNSKGKKSGADANLSSDETARLKSSNNNNVEEMGDKENESGNMGDRYSKDVLSIKQEQKKVVEDEDGMIKARYDVAEQDTGELLVETRDFVADDDEYETRIGLSKDVAERLVYAAIDSRGMKMLQMEERLEKMGLQIAKIMKEKGDNVTNEKSTTNNTALEESVERLDGLVQQVLQLNLLSKSDDMKRFEALSHSIAGIMNEHEVLRNTCHVLHQQVGTLLDRVCVLERNDSNGEQHDEDVWSIPAVKADLKRLLKDVQYQKEMQMTDDVAKRRQSNDHHGIMGIFGVFRALLGAVVHHGAVKHVLVPLLAAVCVQRVSSRPYNSSKMNKKISSGS
jgi:hypothetical protein